MSEPHGFESSTSQVITDSRFLGKPLGHSEVKRVGRFDLMMRLGSGGMASLYLARLRGPESFEKLVAIKKIHDHLTDDRNFVNMFLDEARLSARIQHPNVVQIYDLGSAEGAYYIAMEYIRGLDLVTVLQTAFNTQSPLLTYPLIARIIADAAAGLHAAHELKGVSGQSLGIVHRDVSPHNLLLSYDGYLKVVDFGIAYAAEKIQHTGTGTLKGKLAYMSPEQARGEKVDRRTDVFALGVVFFEAVTRRRLFREESEARTYQRVTQADVPDPSELRPDLPPKLAEIIRKALSLDREDRFQTAAAMQESIEGYLLSEQIRVGPPQLAELMEALFHDRKVALDAKLQELSTAPDIGQIEPSSAPRATGSNATLQSASAQISDLRSPGRSRWGLYLAAILGIAVLSVGLFLGLRYSRGGDQAPSGNSDASKASRSTTKDAGAARAPSSANVVLTFILTPKEATLILDGKEHERDRGEFQRRVEVPRKDTPISVRISAPGYGDKLSEILPVADQTIPINLVRVEDAPSPRDSPGRTMGITTVTVRPRPQSTPPTGSRPAMTLDSPPRRPSGMRRRIVGDDTELD
ncbi:MAG: serine/threonine-protein kinase [Polyangia bacterium]|jgi:serine/threonine-protein kinase|nr:serine/threonine-protein kinase [Polyangia bacterium]